MILGLRFERNGGNQIVGGRAVKMEIEFAMFASSNHYHDLLIRPKYSY